MRSLTVLLVLLSLFGCEGAPVDSNDASSSADGGTLGDGTGGDGGAGDSASPGSDGDGDGGGNDGSGGGGGDASGGEGGPSECDGQILSAEGCVELTPGCGNGIREGEEQCDDGNTTFDDGCSESCEAEDPYGTGPVLGEDTPFESMPDVSSADGPADVPFRSYGGQVTIVVSGVDARADFSVFLQSDEDNAVTTGVSTMGADAQLDLILPYGAYVIRFGASTTTSVSVLITTTGLERFEGIPEPGDDKDSAQDMGTLSEQPILVTGYVGALDGEDYYRFELLNPASLALFTSELEGRVVIQLFQDAPVIDETTPFATLDSYYTSLSMNLPRGVYYARVIPHGANNFYTLQWTAAEYAVIEAEPEPGSDKDAAVDLGTLSETPAIVGGYIGALDGEDYYRFELLNPASLALFTSELEGRVVIQLFQDAPVIDETTPFASLDSYYTSLSMNLPRGAYYARVIPHGANNLYTLQWTAAEYAAIEAEPEPGSDKDAAVDLGTLSETPAIVGGYVGALDGEDYYRFELPNPAGLALTSELEGRVVIQLFQDALVIDETMPLATLDSYYTSLSMNLPRGVYYARVIPHSANNLYTLQWTAAEYAAIEAEPEPGSDKDAAVDLGTLSETPAIVGGYIGALDGEDYYRFELANPSSVSLFTSELEGRVVIQFFEDSPVIDETTPFATLDTYYTSLTQPLEAGVYYARVIPHSANSLYTLQWTATAE